MPCLLNCILLSILIPLSGCGAVSRSDQIADVFRQYRDAVAARDGRTAASLMAAPTVEEYETFRDLALTAEPSDLQRERPSFQLMALTLRQLVDAGFLESADGRAVCAVFVDHSSGVDEPTQVQLAMFTYSEDRASALLQVDGLITRRRVHFFEEQGNWRIDLRQSDSADEALEAAAQHEGVPLEEYLVRRVAERTGQSPREDLWQPLRPADGA